MTEIERRRFLKMSGGGLLTMLASPLLGPRRAFGFADGEVRPTLVTIYLRGGLDQLNTIVPYMDKRYYKIRPTIAIPRDGDEESPGVIRLDRRWGMHPALKALEPFYRDGRVAPIINVGSHHPTRSHFDAQDFMEYAAPGNRTVKNGWLNRYLEATSGNTGRGRLRALAMQGLLPRSLRGRYPVLAVPGDVKKKSNDKVIDMFKDLYGCEGPMVKEAMRGNAGGGKRPGDDAVVITGRDTIETLERFKKIIRDPKTKNSQVKYPRGRVAERLRNVAQVIRAGAGLEVAAIDIGGWDHHTNEGGTDGLINRMLGDLGSSLAAFMTDLGPALDNTVVLVQSEFGRTCAENGNRGTDHGHGGMFLLMGGKIKGGKVYGKWPGLSENRMYQGRDLTVTTDFRDVFAEVLTKHMRFDVPKDFFPDHKPGRGLGLL